MKSSLVTLATMFAATAALNGCTKKLYEPCSGHTIREMNKSSEGAVEIMEWDSALYYAKLGKRDDRLCAMLAHRGEFENLDQRLRAAKK